ncbi:MAG: glycosyltransferase [Candidatus Binatia bacterium]|nr:glycosyltransferase [Candidatus Binatia bacterium]
MKCADEAERLPPRDLPARNLATGATDALLAHSEARPPAVDVRACSQEGQESEGANANDRSVLDLSVVVPIFNERPNLPPLHLRLTRVLAKLGRTYEICYIDDGSNDGSLSFLLECAAKDPHVRVVELARNCGQHAAILAGFFVCRGDVVVTLDADLQNPPEEIPRLLDAVGQGADVVGGRRVGRRDSQARIFLSRVINSFVALLTGASMQDLGCMLRAYRREVVREVILRSGNWTFIPVLANAVAKRAIEIPVRHAARFRGRSRYSVLGLLRLGRALLATMPVLLPRWLGPIGLVSAITGATLVGLSSATRGPHSAPSPSPQFLLGVVGLCVGIGLVCAGLVGTTLRRTPHCARRNPPYVIRAVHEFGQP